IMERKKSKTILVTGGAGYIGSFIVRQLLEEGYDVVVYDNLVKGHIRAVPEEAIFIEGDLADKDLLDEVFNKYNIDSVIHLAAYIEVRESKIKPAKYFDNNIINTVNLLEAMNKHKVKQIVFSSTAAIYGVTEDALITESTPCRPTNPYGESKFIVEKILAFYDESKGIKSISLRYFNAAGASEDGRLGEDHLKETHLIPKLLSSALGKRKFFELTQDKYPTPDGTGIRDYIHVKDLANAHILALHFLEREKKSDVFNIGTGHGSSVKEVVDKVEEVVGKKLPKRVTTRKLSGVARLVASFEKAKRQLGWTPTIELHEIIETAWKWHKNNPDGYKDMQKEDKRKSELDNVLSVVKAMQDNQVIDDDLKFEIVFRLLVDLAPAESYFVKKARKVLSEISEGGCKDAVGESKELTELFAFLMNKDLDPSKKLVWAILAIQLDLNGYQGLARTFIRKTLESGEAEARKIAAWALWPDFALLKSPSLPTRIRALWRLRDIYFATSLSREERSYALEIIFEALKDRTGDQDLWKNAKEILTEILESKEENIWALALERSIKALQNEEEKEAWIGIEEAIIPVREEKEKENMVKYLVNLLNAENDNLRQGIAYIFGEMVPQKLDVVKPLIEQLKREKDEQTFDVLTVALGKIGKEHAAPGLLELLNSLREDSNTDFRPRRIIRALSKLNYVNEDLKQKVIQELLWWISAPKIQDKAIYALSNLGVNIVSDKFQHKIDPPRRSAQEIAKLEPQMVANGIQEYQFSDENGNLREEFTFVPQEFFPSKFHSNPLDIYENKTTKERILVKGGNEYVIQCEYICQRFFALMGLPVPKMSLVKAKIRDRHGRITNKEKLVLAIEFFEGYEEGNYRLPIKYHQDSRIKNAIIISALLSEIDRVPFNMLFNDTQGDIIHIDFACLFARPSGGFKPFSSNFSYSEFKNTVQTTRLDGKNPVNEAYGNAMNDPEILSELATRIGAITDDQIRAIIRSAKIPYGKESISLLKEWIAQLEAEGDLGNWNRKSRDRFLKPIATFNKAIECG
ncbi:MAG: UDP-glucose 4-epimerase GalE, partial [Methanosarcinales archaeon]